MKILFIRHGETDWNRDLKIQGRKDNPLNDTGRKQAEEAGKKLNNLKPTKLISSPLDRTIETMTIIKNENNWDLDIERDSRFLERDFGELEGAHPDKYKSIKDLSKVDRFEQNDAIENRANDGINDIINSSNEKDIIVVTCHSHTIKAILSSNFSDDFDYSYKLKNCAVVQTEFKGDRLEFINII